MASPPGGVSAGPGGVSLTSTSAGEVVGSGSGVSSLGGHPGDEGVVLSAPWASVELDSVSDIGSGGWGNRVPLWDPHVLAFGFRGITP